jgi:hypothetical protein
VAYGVYGILSGVFSVVFYGILSGILSVVFLWCSIFRATQQYAENAAEENGFRRGGVRNTKQFAKQKWWNIKQFSTDLVPDSVFGLLCISSLDIDITTPYIGSDSTSLKLVLPNSD